jgi:hypothetical protein
MAKNGLPSGVWSRLPLGATEMRFVGMGNLLEEGSDKVTLGAILPQLTKI